MAVLLPNGKQQYDAANGVPAVGYQLFTYDVGTTNPRTTWSNEGQSAANTNPIILDARGEAVIFWSGDYTVTLKDNLGSTIWSVDGVNSSAASLLDNYVVDTGAANAYIANGITANVLVAGLKVAVKIANNNTAASTLNYGGLGVKSVITNGSVLHGGELKAGVIYIFEYDGTNFQLLNPSNGANAAEIAAGVVPSNINYLAGDIRRYGAIADAAVNGTSGTDNTTAINTAMSVTGQPAFVPAGNFGFKNLLIPGGATLSGQGIHESNLIALTGSVGTMCTDTGSAAKLNLSGLAFYCNNCAYTAGLKLGYNATAFGTEGYIDQIWVRDLPSGFPGIDITQNVGEFGFLIVQATGGIRILGSSIMVDKIESVQSSGFVNTGGVTSTSEFGDGSVQSMHVEAPQNNTVSYYLTGNCSIDQLTISLTAGYVADHLIEIGASATTWRIGNLKYYFKAGAAVNIVGNIKSGTQYFGGRAGDGGSNSFAGQGNYADSSFNAGNTFAVKLQQIQSFKIRVTNTAAVIQHRMGNAGDSSQASNFLGQINNASQALTNTPTGADNATAMAAGAKIGSASPHILWLDTNVIVPADSLFQCNLVFNSTTTAYSVLPFISSININGVTQNRLALQLTNATTGANVNWAVALGTAGWILDITFLGFLR